MFGVLVIPRLLCTKSTLLCLPWNGNASLTRGSTRIGKVGNISVLRDGGSLAGGRGMGLWPEAKGTGGAPPDLESLFEAAGVPDKLTNGQPPFSPEWYAGAKERQRLRDLEIEHLLSTRNDARHHWAELVWTDLEIWQDRIDFTVSLPEPLADLQALLARTKHERPDDVEGFRQIQDIAAKAEVRQLAVRADMSDAKQHMTEIEDKVRRREAQDEAAEKERLEIKRLAEKRRRRAERVLKRNEALLRGEDPPPLIEDSDLEPVNAEIVATRCHGLNGNIAHLHPRLPHRLENPLKSTASPLPMSLCRQLLRCNVEAWLVSFRHCKILRSRHCELACEARANLWV
ncbi:unnamed protein product [Effrenium voratum]|nr:unnamed protein product [Effrenium voratum]